MFGFQIQVRRAFVQRAKEQRRNDNSEGPIAAQQCDSDSDETVFRRKADSESARIAQDLSETNQAGDSASGAERNDSDSVGIDACGTRRGFVLTDGANFETQ